MADDFNILDTASEVTVNITEFPAAAAAADNFANPTTTQIVAMLSVWDGTNWDRALSTGGRQEVLLHDGTTRATVRELGANDALNVAICDAAGAQIVSFGGAGLAEDAAHTTGDTGVMALAVRNDAATSLSGTDGDYSPVAVTAQG